MAEKTEKQKEKTKKSEAEEARKHAKREEFRKKNKDKLDGITKEADTKIKKEKDHKAKLQKAKADTQKEGAEKMKASEESVQKDKAAAQAKFKALEDKNAKQKADQEAAVAAIAAKAKAADAAVMATVKQHIAAEEAKQQAKQAVEMAKQKRKEAVEASKTQKVLADGITAINKRFADDKAASEKRKAETDASMAKIKKRANDAKAAEMKKDSKFHGPGGKLAKMEAKEAKQKADLQAETARDVAYAQKHNPGIRKVKRLERQQMDVTKQLVRQATREELRGLHRSRAAFQQMTERSAETFAGLSSMGISALRKGIESDDADKVNRQVAHAWGLAVGEAPNPAEAEALTLARGGVTDLLASPAHPHPGPHGEVVEAWRGALGNRPAPDPRDKDTGPIDEETQAAFAAALGPATSAVAEEAAEEEVTQAWRSALAGGKATATNQPNDAALLQALGLGKVAPENTVPPAAEVLDPTQEAAPVADFVEVALATEESRPLPTIPESDLKVLGKPAAARPKATDDANLAAEAAVAAVLRKEEHTKRHPEEKEALLRLSRLERGPEKPKSEPKRLAVVVRRTEGRKAVVIDGDSPDAVVPEEKLLGAETKQPVDRPNLVGISTAPGHSASGRAAVWAVWLALAPALALWVVWLA